MVRLAWPIVVSVVVLVVVSGAFAAPALGAGALPSRMGMYTQQGTPLAMLDSKIVVRVRGPVAEAIITQTFRNDTNRVTEATYIFPLPVDAAVSAMEIETGSRTIRAAIEAREHAQQRYETAVAAGVGAALLDQERPDVFTQTVSAIPAQGTVVVTLRLDTIARYQGGRWELVLPMVVAPRYVPGTASGRPTTGTGRAADTDRAPDASRVTPRGAPGAGGKTDIVVELGDAVDDVTSPTHDLVKTKAGYTIHDPKSDHDAVIRWRAKAPAAGWVEPGDDGGFAAVVIEAPPAGPRKGATRMMLVLDRAATTRGDADAVKRPFVRALLGSLDGKDSVAVTGSDKLDWRGPDQALRALDETWSKAGAAIDLTKALSQARSEGAPLVLVTDGLVADDRAVLAVAAKVGVPIHVVGIGPAPNRGLLTAIAAASGGTVRFIIVGDDVTALARDVLADTAAPPEPLSVTWGTLVASDVVPASLPRLGAGQAMLVVAKVKRVQAANARVRGDVFGFATVIPPRAPEGATTTRGSLARRWAKLKLDELVAAGNAKTIREHALRHGLVSPYTSMVAIGDEVVVQGGVRHSVSITVSVPEGMRWQLVKREITLQLQGTLADKQRESKNVPVTPKTTEHTTTTVTGNATGTNTGKKSTERVAEPPRDPQPAPQAEPTPGDYAREGKADDQQDSMRSPPSPAPDTSVATGASAAESISLDEALDVHGMSGTPRRRTRLSLALGGGVAVVNGDAALAAALAGRFEVGRQRAFGMEGSLWLVDGSAQGSVLGTATVRGIARRLEVGIGAGLRITGDAAGPAFNLMLRTRLPLRGLSTYLRYDGALLLHDSTYDGQNAGSFGVEASF